MTKEFPKEQELEKKTARLGELNVLLDIGGNDKVLLDEGADEVERKVERKKNELGK